MGNKMFLNNIFFGCEIWAEPSNYSMQIAEKLPVLVVHNWKVTENGGYKMATNIGFVPNCS